MSGLVETITSAMNHPTEHPVTDSDNFVDYQTNMVSAAKEIARLAQEMVAKSTSNATQLGSLSGSVCENYSRLSADCWGAVRHCSSDDVAARLKTTVHDLGGCCIKMVKSGGSCQAAPR